MNARGRLDIRPCVTCGRRTRAVGITSAQAHGTVIRYGDYCSACRPAPTGRGGESPASVSVAPLSADESVVAQLIRSLSSTTDEADDLLAMLGLVREVQQ